MKHQIASFLGELAEELGWEPELEDEIRVKGETNEPAQQTAQKDARSSSHAARLARDLRQLREKLEHLSSEVTELRAQMARLRGVPAPPDALPQPPIEWQDAAPPPPALGLGTPPAESPAAASPALSSQIESAEDRPWPPRLFSTAIPATEPDQIGDDAPMDDSSDGTSVLQDLSSDLPHDSLTRAAAKIPDLGDTAVADVVADAEIDGDEQDAAPADAVEAAAVVVNAPIDATAQDAAVETELDLDDDIQPAPVAVLENELDSALELFPKEPKRKSKRTKKAAR